MDGIGGSDRGELSILIHFKSFVGSSSNARETVDAPWRIILIMSVQLEPQQPVMPSQPRPRLNQSSSRERNNSECWQFCFFPENEVRHGSFPQESGRFRHSAPAGVMAHGHVSRPGVTCVRFFRSLAIESRKCFFQLISRQ
jgi:hypothetical protein